MSSTVYRNLKIWKACWRLAGLVHEQSSGLPEPACICVRRLAIDLLDDLDRFFEVLDTEDKPEAMLIGVDTLLKLEEEMLFQKHQELLTEAQWTVLQPHFDTCKNFLSSYHIHYISLLTGLKSESAEQRQINQFQTQLITTHKMNMNQNSVSLIGRTGVTPTISHSKSGSKKATFVLAALPGNSIPVKEPGKTNWFKMVAFDSLAEMAEKYLTKGQMVAINGKLTSREIPGATGKMKTITEVVVNHIHIIRPKKENSGVVITKPEVPVQKIQVAERKAG